MFGVSEHRRRALFCSAFLKLWDMRVDLNATSKKLDCHLSWPYHLLKHASPFKNNKKRSRMQHVYEVYGNWINMAFVKGLLAHKGYREWKSEKKIVLKQLPLYHTFPASLFVLVIPSLLVTLYHHEILSHPLWRNQKKLLMMNTY